VFWFVCCVNDIYGGDNTLLRGALCVSCVRVFCVLYEFFLCFCFFNLCVLCV